MNLTEATEKACKEPTLARALMVVCMWEHERLIAEKQPGTCFYACIQSVLDAWHDNNS